MKKLVTLAACSVMAVSLMGCYMDNADVGTVGGAIVGGVIGSQFGGGGGQVAATIGGAIVGGFVGNQIGSSMDYDNGYYY